MTERVRVDLGDRGYDIVVGTGAIDELASVFAGRRRVAIVTQPADRDRARRLRRRAAARAAVDTQGLHDRRR